MDGITYVVGQNPYGLRAFRLNRVTASSIVIFKDKKLPLMITISAKKRLSETLIWNQIPHQIEKRVNG